MKPYYEHAGITIYHGDCREILPTLPKVDLVLTDPPYKISTSGGGIGGRCQYLSDIRGQMDSGFCMTVLRGFSRWMVFCGKEQLQDLLSLAIGSGNRWMLITWNKSNPTPLVNNNYLPDTEYIIHCFESSVGLYGSYRDRSRFILHPAGKDGVLGHPTIKPLSVIKRLVRTGSDLNQIILDPFMGSGTTLVAAKQLGRRSIGIEIEEKYCEIAVKRLRQEVLPLESG